MNDDKDLPNFLRPNRQPQECKDAAMWQKHLAVAHFGLIALGIITGVFLNKPLAGIAMLAAALLIYLWSIRLATKHAKWHLENNKKGNH